MMLLAGEVEESEVGNRIRFDAFCGVSLATESALFIAQDLYSPASV